MSEWRFSWCDQVFLVVETVVYGEPGAWMGVFSTRLSSAWAAQRRVPQDRGVLVLFLRVSLYCSGDYICSCLSWWVNLHGMTYWVLSSCEQNEVMLMKQLSRHHLISLCLVLQRELLKCKQEARNLQGVKVKGRHCIPSFFAILFFVSLCEVEWAICEHWELATGGLLDLLGVFTRLGLGV